MQNNKKLVEKYTKLMSEASFLDTLGDINLNPFKLLGFGTGQSNTQSQNAGGPQSGGGFGGGAGGSQIGGGGGSREDRKRSMRDDQSVTDYGKMLNRASDIRDARLAKIDASRTPEAVAKRKTERIAKSKAEDAAMGITPEMTPAEIQEKRKAKREADSKARIDSNARLSQDALDMIKANKDERDVINADPVTMKLRADAEARTAARWDADHAGREDKPYVNPNSPEGRIAAQNAAEYASGSGPGRAVDDQRDSSGRPKNMETARADVRRDSAKVEAEMRAEDAKKNGPPKNVEPGSELPSRKPPSFARPGTLSRKT